MPRTKTLVILLWLAFLVRGAWYCAVLPAWEGYDEAYHFAALQHIASGQGLAHTDTPISLEVQKSLHLLPVPWELQFQSIPRPLITHEDFWKLPADERRQRIDAVHMLNPEAGSQPSAEPILNYEAQQPPLYYWVFAVPLRWMSSLPLLSRLYLLRFLNLLVASVAIPIAYWIARRVFRSDAQALGATGVIVLLPELMINVARVGNESLALVCYTAMLAGAVWAVQRPSSWRAWLLLGAALGCGLLTKAYVLSAVPAVIAVAVLSRGVWSAGAGGRPKLTAIGVRVSAALIIAILISGAWYARVHATTGSWTGVTTDAAVGRVSLLGKLATIPHVNWKSGFLSILISHVWFGAWSFLRVPRTLYVISFAVIALAIAGMFRGLLRRRGTVDEKRAVIVLTAFYLCFWAGLLYEVVIDYMVFGVSASAGWYLYAAVAAEVVLLVWGLESFLSVRVVISGLAVGIAALDLYGTHALVMPYYTGFTAHTGDSVRSALWAATSHLPTIFDRLAQLRPPWLNVPALVICWLGYWVATVGTATAVVLLFRKRSADA
jgi:4-amino-4-deoxy-L-arabinose transferase-like glycosyltransferase